MIKYFTNFFIKTRQYFLSPPPSLSLFILLLVLKYSFYNCVSLNPFITRSLLNAYDVDSLSR